MREALAWQKQRHWLEPPKLHAAAGIWAGVGASVQATCGANKAAHSVLKREEKPEAAAAAVVIRAPLIIVGMRLERDRGPQTLGGGAALHVTFFHRLSRGGVRR